jgi:hypothetical protein
VGDLIRSQNGGDFLAGHAATFAAIRAYIAL